jgi:hypothetical protein
VQFRANARVLRNDADDTFNGTLTITGSVKVFDNLSVSGNADVVGLLSVTGGAFVRGPANIRGGATIANGASITGGATIFGGMRVRSGGIEVSGNASITGNVGITGNLSISGKATSASTVSSDIGKTLVTKDYVDLRSGPKFITPVVIYNVTNPGSFSNSLISVPPQIPTTATALILDTEIVQYQPDGDVGNSVYETSILVSNNRSDRYKIGANRSSGKGDTVANVCQATIPFNTTARNFYLHLIYEIKGGAVIRIVGYY